MRPADRGSFFEASTSYPTQLHRRDISPGRRAASHRPTSPLSGLEMASMSNAKTALLTALLLTAPLHAAQAGSIPDLDRETLAPGDGWASLATTAMPQGTTGGSAAAPARVHTVSDRNALVAALNFPDATPKI